jgi:hypothetical protein
MPGYEKNAATGTRAKIAYCRETVWGVSPASGYRELLVVGGETLDDNINMYRSNILRSNRVRQQSVRGTRRPGGSLPFELTARGMGFLFLHLLGSGADGVTGYAAPSAGSATDEVQQIKFTGVPTGGTFRLEFEGQTTADITYSATPATLLANVDSALELLSNIGTGNVVTTAPDAATVNVTFGPTSGPADNNVRTMNFINTGLTGGTNPDGFVTTTTEGLVAGQFVHQLSGGITLPVGFTLEKQFTDLSTVQYMALRGCRINSCQMSFNVDQMVTGSFDILARESTGLNSASVGAAPSAQPSVAPFTSVQAALKKDGVTLATCQNLSLNINNNLYGDAGFVLGSNFRSSLKPGWREVGGEATFIFDDASLYAQSVSGATLAIEINCQDSNDESVVIKIPTAQLLPSGAAPKIENDGPLSIRLPFESIYNNTLQSDIQMLITNNESTLLV